MVVIAAVLELRCLIRRDVGESRGCDGRFHDRPNRRPLAERTILSIGPVRPDRNPRPSLSEVPYLLADCGDPTYPQTR